MNRSPHDFDVATDATPDQVEALFPDSIGVGKAFGVMILPFEGFQIEIATFREDLEYRDGRRPEGVRFSSPEADAKRRDFTVNALFYDIETGKVIDYVGGEADIKRKLIHTVGEPAKRFEEDKLRVLRGIRFSAQLDFSIEAGTLEAIRKFAPETRAVSRERVRDEILKLMKSPLRVKGLALLNEPSILEGIFPKLAPFVRKDGKAWLERFQIYSNWQSKADLTALLVLFFYPARAGADFREALLKDLKLDNKQIDSISFVFKNLEEFLEPRRVRKGEMLLLLANAAAPSAEIVAGTLERLAHPSSSTARTAREEVLHGLLAPFPNRQLPTAFVTGEDMKQAGWTPGKTMGAGLHEAYLLQLEGSLASRNQALAWIKEALRSST
jgi:tRNA nucleotidyltransferase/poly(A) polymerase